MEVNIIKDDRICYRPAEVEHFVLAHQADKHENPLVQKNYY